MFEYEELTPQDDDQGRRDVHDYRDRYAGLPVAEFDRLCPPEGDQSELPDAGSVAWRLSVDPFEPEETFADQFARFAERVDTTAVRAIVIGGWDNASSDATADVATGLLMGNVARFPALRALFVGAMISEDCEMSWIQQADITPVLRAFPQLQRLDVRGSTKLRLNPIRHEALRMLRVEAAGLPAEVVRAVGDSELPALEHLELWLGTADFGGTATVADLAGICAGKGLPALRHLGLRNSEIQNEIAAVLASAPVVSQLTSLSLSLGTLGDVGAEALLSGQPLTHLRALDLHYHFLSDPMMRRLVEALPGVEVDLSQAQAEYIYDDDEAYVAIAE